MVFGLFGKKKYKKGLTFNYIYDIIYIEKRKGDFKMTVICYKTKTPTIYNKGTKHESYCDQFLAYYTYKNQEEAQKEVDEINATKPDKLWNDTPIDWERIDYFFVDDQEAMY